MGIGQQGKSDIGRAPRSSSGRVLVKVFAWVLAVPALCTLVVLGGAAPIYLLLPKAPSTPVHREGAAVSNARTDRAEEGAPIRRAAASSQALPDKESTGPELGAEPPPVAENALIPAEDMEAEQPAKVETSVVPTPRPAFEIAALATTAGNNAGSADRQGVRRGPPVLSSSTRAKAQDSAPKRRSVTIRPVALRSGPSGREIKALERGAEVIVGACKNWCQVESDGVAGWLHPSFLADVGKANARARPEEQTVAPRAAAPRDGYRVIRERPRPYREYRAERPERYVHDERWPDEDREPVEFYGYE